MNRPIINNRPVSAGQAGPGTRTDSPRRFHCPEVGRDALVPACSSQGCPSNTPLPLPSPRVPSFSLDNREAGSDPAWRPRMRVRDPPPTPRPRPRPHNAARRKRAWQPVTAAAPAVIEVRGCRLPRLVESCATKLSAPPHR